MFGPRFHVDEITGEVSRVKTSLPPQLPAEATISRDLTDGKVSQEIALLEALGTRYGITLSIPEPTQAKSTPVPMRRESTQSVSHNWHQSGPDEASKLYSRDEAGRETGISLHTPTKSSTIQSTDTGGSSALSAPQHYFARPQPLQDKRPPSEKKVSLRFIHHTFNDIL